MVNKTGTLLAGKTLRGGLIYAGVNGANNYQGDPKKIKPAPRIGTTFAIDTNTVLRGGYGLYWAPWNYPGAGTGYGQTGFTRSTSLNQSSAESEVPRVTLDNPFPSGLLQPIGSSLGLLTGVGGQIDYLDQTKGSPRVHQYSADIERELPGAMAVNIGYVGATGRDIGYGGTTDALININQIDPALARQQRQARGHRELRVGARPESTQRNAALFGRPRKRAPAVGYPRSGRGNESPRRRIIAPWLPCVPPPSRAPSIRAMRAP
jgi:hypothetical protein